MLQSSIATLQAALWQYTDARSALVFTVCLLVGLAWTSSRRRGPGKLPPGPSGVPIFGVLPRLLMRFKDRYKLYEEWARQYGDMYSMRLGQYDAVMLNDPALVREAFVKQGDIFSDRPVHAGKIKKFRNNSGLVLHNGPSLFHLRKFTLTVMKEFGVGKQSLETKIHEEIKASFQEIDKFDGQPFYPRDMLAKAVSNIISSIVFGTRFEYTDSRFNELMNFMDFVAKTGGSASPFVFLPLPQIFTSKRFATYAAGFEVLSSLIRQKIEDHRVGFDENNIRDFIDLYLGVEKEKGHGKITEENMLMAIQDLFIAGTETTSTTLQWCLVYMLLHPEVQQKCRQEILQVIGQGRLPVMADRSSLLYTEATILEVQRMSNIATTSLPHCTSADARLGGYSLPKGTIVFANIYRIHMDERHWRAPHSFNPDRWIDGSGRLIRSDAFVPFSIGRRACLGENLAKMELFLYFTSLLQNYTFTTGDGAPSTDGEEGLTCLPKRFTLRALSV